MGPPVLLAALALATPLAVADPPPELRFAWPSRGSALVELTDERRIGGTLRASAISMRMTVAPDGASDRLLVRFSDRRTISGDSRAIESADPAGVGAAVGRVLARATPAFVVSADGDFLEPRDLDATLREVMQTAGFPAMPPVVGPFRDLVTSLAAEDWNAWVAFWRGPLLEPGEWATTETDGSFNGTAIPIRLTRRALRSSNPGWVRLQAEAAYPADAVRTYTSGFLIDLAIEAKEIGGEDAGVNARFLERARFSPMTQTLTVDLEVATLRPIVVERLRTFSAEAGRHRVEGTERRVHRFTWDTGAE